MTKYLEPAQVSAFVYNASSCCFLSRYLQTLVSSLRVERPHDAIDGQAFNITFALRSSVCSWSVKHDDFCFGSTGVAVVHVDDAACKVISNCDVTSVAVYKGKEMLVSLTNRATRPESVDRKLHPRQTRSLSLYWCGDRRARSAIMQRGLVEEWDESR